jgi:alcohol dehydrogenase
MRNCITVRGQWMYPPEAVTRMTGMVRAGLVRLDDFAVTSFDLDHVNEAVAHAAANARPFQMTVLQPI